VGVTVCSTCGIWAAHPCPPSEPDGVPRVPHVGFAATVVPGMKTKLAREPAAAEGYVMVGVTSLP
jgi:hypothetical protein